MFRASNTRDVFPTRPAAVHPNPGRDMELTDRGDVAHPGSQNIERRPSNPRTSSALVMRGLPTVHRPTITRRQSQDDQIRDQTIGMMRELAFERRAGDPPGLPCPTASEPTVKTLKRMMNWLEKQNGFLQHLNNVRVPIQKHLPGIVATLTARAAVTAGIDAKYLDISDTAKTVLQNVNLGVWTVLELGQALNEERLGVATRQSRIGHATSVASYVAALGVTNGMQAAGAVSEVGLMINLYVALRDSYNAYAVTRSNVHNPPDEVTGQPKLSTSLMALGGATFGLAALAFSPAMNTREAHDAADTVLGQLQSVAKKILAGFGSAGDTMPLDVLFDLTMAYGGAAIYGVKRTMQDGSEQHVKGFEGMKAVKTWLDYQPFTLKEAVPRILKQQATTGMARAALLQSYNGMVPFFDFVQEKTLGLGNYDNIVIVGGKTVWFGVTVSPMFLERPYLKKLLEKKDEEGAGELSQPGVFQPVQTDPGPGPHVDTDTVAPVTTAGVGTTLDAATTWDDGSRLNEAVTDLDATVRTFNEQESVELEPDSRPNTPPHDDDREALPAGPTDDVPASVHLNWQMPTGEMPSAVEMENPYLQAYMERHAGDEVRARDVSSATGQGDVGEGDR